MCGICGFSGPDDMGLLERMTGALRHRGPDDSGYFSDGSMNLGHRRLSIIDLESGHQPIHNEDETVWIVFNGEIYNYKKIKRDLEKMGHRFYTDSDTEVIVHAFEEYGDDCIQYLEGMFAFALWDRRSPGNEKLFLARDRMGIKPLYYSVNEGCMVFASELKSVVEYLTTTEPDAPLPMDELAVNNYLSHLYIPAPLTIYKGIRKLQPAHCLSFHAGTGKIDVNEYWDVAFEDNASNRNAITKAIISGLEKSVGSHLVSDVPVGAFLSGGIDSSAVVAVASHIMDEPLQTFTIGFPCVEFDETGYAQLVADRFGTDHHVKTVEPDMMDILPRLVKHFDEPFGDSSAIPTFYLSEFTSGHVKVVLSGDGGDELFGGYMRYRWTRLGDYYQMLPRFVRNGIERATCLAPGRTLGNARIFLERSGIEDPDRRFMSWIEVFDEDMKKQLWNGNGFDAGGVAGAPGDVFFDYLSRQGPHNRNGMTNTDSRNRMMYADMKVYLPDDVLTKVDRTSMYHSLEVRVPLLGHRFVDVSAAIPPDYKLHGLEGKYALKKALRKVLPREILHRKKMGFGLPIQEWFRGELRGYVEDTLLERHGNHERSFSRDYIEKIIRMNLRKERDFTYRIYGLIVFEEWMRNCRVA